MKAAQEPTADPRPQKYPPRTEPQGESKWERSQKREFLQITGGREVVISQSIFPSTKGKSNKAKHLATDGEQDQLGKSLWGLKGKTAAMLLSRVSRFPPAWDIFIF